MGWFAVALSIGAWLFATSAEAQSERRVALVIGNAAYREAPLENPVNDARAMAAKLAKLGYEVDRRENLGLREMTRAVTMFGDTLRRGGGHALFYFAGHGMQVEGRNYLIPVDAEIVTENAVISEAVDVDMITRQLDKSGKGVSILVLDACRNNPYERRFRGGGRGLALIDAPSGTLIAYATAPGRVAADGVGANGVYTGELLKVMDEPGLKVEEVFKRVRARVTEQTGGAQTPWETSSITGDFYFVPKGSTVTVTPPGVPLGGFDERQIELAAWQSLGTNPTPALLEAFLTQFPNGSFAPLAKVRLEERRAAAEKAAREAERKAKEEAEKQRLSATVTPAAPPAPSPPSGSPPVRPAVGVPPGAPPPPEPGSRFRDCPTCPEMVVLPPGSFMMGVAAGEEAREELPDPQRGQAEPQRRVTIQKPFALARSHVTRGEYAAFMTDTGRPTPDGCREFKNNKWVPMPGKSWRSPGYEQTDNHPAVCVSWDDAKAYVQWLALKSGKAYRLPSEAEWEYAARAGTSTSRYWGDNPHESCQFANMMDRTRIETLKLKETPGRFAMCHDGYVHSAPSGSFRANGFGLHDMLGNAWQWVEDCWSRGYGGAPMDGSAVTQGECRARVARGGSWGSTPDFVRAAFRIRFEVGTSIHYHNTGFRVARTL
jgi:formylglycine-generating enzyme required for sulfatase activity